MTPTADQLALMAALFSGAMTAVFLLAWHSLGRQRHALTWALASAVLALRCTLGLSMAGLLPEAVRLLLAGAMELTFVTLALRGHCQRTDCSILPQRLWPFAAGLFAAHACFNVVVPHAGIGSAILPYAGALALFLGMHMVNRHRDEPLPVDRAAAVVMLVFGVGMLVSAGTAVLQGAAGDAAYAVLQASIKQFLLPLGLGSLGMLSILMLSSDLSIQMQDIAVRDELTGLLNRRGFSEQASKAYSSARRTGQGLSVIMSDIDRFKDINDAHGHAAGDDALRQVARILENGRRTEDILARMGGEEFALVLPGSDIAESMRIATELCQRVERATLAVGGCSVSITASFGVATITDLDSCLSDVIVRADKALYRSKRAGRNRVDLDSSQVILLENARRDRESAG